MSQQDLTGGVAAAEVTVGSAATAVATEFLKALEERDLERAGAYLAERVVMRFPNAEFDSLTGMVAAAGGRYRWVKKRVEAVETCTGAGSEVVYVRGTLYGENLDGRPFEGVRFIDRFEIRSGKIAAQDVWNDLAESGVLARRS